MANDVYDGDGDLDFEGIMPIEIPFKYKDATYILREASEAASVQYRDAVMRATRTDADGRPVGLEGLASAEPLFVSLCVYRANEVGRLSLLQDGETPDPKALVGIDVIRSWPSRVVKPIFEKAKRISGLDDGSKESIRRQIDLLQKYLTRLEAVDASPPAKN